jgi:hypothetical protein
MKQLESDPEFLERLERRFREMPDADVTEVLKKRDQYQRSAIDFAVREALRRGLIHSEEEMDEPRFSQESARFTLFPLPEKTETRTKIFRSLCRSLMIAGVIPAFYGVMKLSSQRFTEGTALISIGVIWIGMSWFLMERSEKWLIFPLFFLLLISVPYVVRIMTWHISLKWTDFFIPSVLFVLIVYSLFYVYAILKNQPARERRE